MWFRKKNINRRLDRRHVLLDVKLRTGQVRSTRMRWGAVALTVAFSTVFGLYLVWRTGGWAMNHFLYENKDFAVQQIDVQTDGVISSDQLRRWAGVKPGDNLLALDLGRVKRDLELVPQVRTAAVERVLPRTLRIRVEEREPLAQVYAPQLRQDGRGYDMRLFQLDSEGVVMLPLESRQRATPLAQAGELLPTLAGIDPNELQPGRKLEVPQLLAALDLIVAFEHSPMAGLADLRRIDISSPGILVATTGQGGELTFAAQDFDQQLRRWRQIYDRGQQMNMAIASLDLAVPNNIPVRWLDARAVVPLAPKPKPAATYRKNNV
jgi:cell division septal protein FtsQ